MYRTAVLAGSIMLMACHAMAQVVPDARPTTLPAPEAIERIRDEADFQRAVVAYRFWYPTVAMEKLFKANRAAGVADNQGIALPSEPTADLPGAVAVLDLTAGPMIIDLPAGPYVVTLSDHHQRWIADIGLLGSDGGKGSKHIVVPRGYRGAVPTGTVVARSASSKVLVSIQAMPIRGDMKAAGDSLRKIRIYPLAAATNPHPLPFIDAMSRPTGSDAAWETGIGFWQMLHAVIDAEPAVREFRAMHGLLATLGLEKGKRFAPDARLAALLEKAARTGHEQMLVAAFALPHPERLAWKDRNWEWAGPAPTSADFETAGGLDLEARNRWSGEAILASPGMSRRAAASGSFHWIAARDRDGAFLDGGKSYRLVLPQPVPARQFWSVTAYDAATRLEVHTDQIRPALRSLVELKDLKKGEAIVLHFGPTPPNGSEARWVKTVPGQRWFAGLRLFGPEKAAQDGTWKAGDIEPVP